MTREAYIKLKTESDSFISAKAKERPSYPDEQNLFLLVEAVYQRHGRNTTMKMLNALYQTASRAPEVSPESNLKDEFKELVQ